MGGHGWIYCWPHLGRCGPTEWVQQPVKGLVPTAVGPSPVAGGTESATWRLRAKPLDQQTERRVLEAGGEDRCFTSLRRRGPPTDSGRCAGAILVAL